MAEKSFGVKEINLIGASGTPTIESPNNLNLNAVNVAISTNATIGGTLSVTGNVSVGGTLTYEDVTNIDSVGIITTREGLFIPDTKELKIGNTASSPDLKFYHNTHSYIINKTGNLRIESDSSNLNDIQILNNKTTSISDHSFNLSAKFISGGSVELYEAGNKKFETSSSGATVTGTLTATSFVKSGGTSSQYLMADGSTTTSGGGGGGGGVTVQDEGSSLSTTATTLNFVGSGVVASGTGATKTITISGGVSTDAQGNTVGGSGAGDSFTGTDAENNTLFGKDAGTAITSADSTTAVGKDAGKSITTGSYNHIFGIGAGDAITTGTNNTIMGHYAGSSFQTASENTIIGGNAGGGSSLGSNNVIIGKSCAQSNGGSDNVFIGQMAVVWASGTGSHNVCVGQGAMEDLTNGNYNTGVGKAVFNDITTASDNSALGHNAGNTLTTGSNNLFLGHDAIPSSASVSNEVTIGDSNINHLRVPGIGVSFSEGGAVLSGVVTATSFVGDGSNLTGISGGGSFTTDSQFNLVAGEDAGSNFSGTSAEKNILLGHDAGRRITTGDNNIAIGDEALSASDGGNITGSGNIAIGRQAMNQKAVTGSGNVIIGDNRAGRLITSGSHNIGMGQYSLHYMATGTGNIAIGYACLDYAEGTGNVAIGHNSGTEVHGTGSSGSYNTLYGYGAGSSLSSGSNCIIIGKNAQASSNSVSDEITLGNTDVNHLRIPGIGVSFSEGGAVFSGIVTATNFAKADGTGLGGLTAESSGSANTHSNNAAGSLTSNSTNNVILGWNAGNTISTGDNNTVIGYRAGGVYNNSQETIIGANCFSDRGSHPKAVGLGYGAGKWNQGDNNTAIGYETVGANGISNGDNNTGVGYAALRGITDGSNNVALGYAANNQHTTGSNCIVIGANADASAVDVSNEITLGDSNITKFRIPGIDFVLKDNGGTPTEGHVLTVDGSGEASFVGIAITEAPVTDYTISANGSSAYRIHGGGVDETANNPDLYLIRGQKYRFNNTTGSSHPFAIRVSNGGSAYTDGVSGSNQGIQFFTVPYDAPASLVYQCTIHSGMVGNIYIRGGSSTANISNNADNRVITGGSGGNLNGEANLTFDGSKLKIATSAGTDAILNINEGTTTNPLRIMQTATESKIQCVASQPFNIRSQSGSGSNGYLAFWTRDIERLRITSTGRINIGDADQTQNVDQFSVTVAAQNAVDNVARFQSTAAASGTSESLVKIYKGAGYGGVISGYITQGSDHGLKFYTANNGSLSERLRINSAGGVGIGTATIDSNKKLDVCDGIISVQAGHTHDTRIEFHRKNTGSLGWIGIPNWDPDGLYIYGPTSNSNEVASKYASGAWHFYTSGTSNSEKLSIASDGTITTLGTTARSDWITTSLKPSFQIASNYNPWFSLFKHSSDPYGPYLLLGKTRGTTSTSNTVVENNDELGNILFEGTDGSTFRPGARIVANVDGAPGSGDMPTRLSFHTTKDGQNNVSEKLRISSMGYVTKPEHPAFHARPPGNYSISGDQVIGGTWSTSDSESFVRGTLANGNPIWNNSTGIFTVPVTGIYFIHWNVFLKLNTTRRDAFIYNGSTIIARTEIGDPGEAANNKSVAVTAVVSLTVNDQIKFGALTTGTTNVIYETVRPWSYACGHLIG